MHGQGETSKSIPTAAKGTSESNPKGGRDEKAVLAKIESGPKRSLRSHVRRFKPYAVPLLSKDFQIYQKG